MLLADIARTSLAVAATSARTEKVALLAELFRTADPAEAPVTITYLAGRLPQRRTGIGWRTLVDRPAPAKTPTLTLGEVNRALDRIALVSGKGSQHERRRLLGELLGRATAAEQDFLVRLIGGELRQGALDAFAVEALAVAVGADAAEVRRAVMLGGSLGSVARALLEGGPAALADFRLEVGRPVQPMLAQSAKDVDEALDRLGPSAVEEKLDGIRVQVHIDHEGEDPREPAHPVRVRPEGRQGPVVRVWTRTLDEITDRLPEVVAAAADLPVTRAVLDGEVVARDADGRPRPFQETSGRVGSRLDVAGAQASLPVSVAFFDLLSLDDRSLLDLPVRERHAELARVVPEALRVRRTAVEDAGESGQAHARAFAEEALARGQEGVVLKALDSAYSAGRRGASWLKVKPVHTLDLVVLGAEWGHGRRTGRLSNLHLGARRADGTFTMLGKTFKGLTDALLAWQTTRLRELTVSEEPWGVLVRPELVVEIAYDGVQRSSRYPAGVTLRFARVVRYREDKRPDDADTIDTVLAALRP
ncbi:ATP-dependent DNA ligase [Streptomyces sp. RKND-216]|uniref:ATP-dependent DNA ligase n=1 Tax=Streptomyces sp. RKND-216 TaxID=2562581 RepID=UPI00109D9521|nr:ATP-dependent DNA ligase [Streptomyces sp. RKND-216]THA25912.1 ATP-dependent DNA ligase [Streptomyces sp. RKND-216]